MNKKKFENSLLALLGVGLIVTSVLLMVQKRQKTPSDDAEREEDYFSPFDQGDRGLHVFSESGILL